MFFPLNVESAFRHVIPENHILPRAIIPSADPIPPFPVSTQQPNSLLTYQPKTPTTPRSIHTLYMEGLSPIDPCTPHSLTQRTPFTPLKMGAEKCGARAVTHEAGEVHLRNEIKPRESAVEPTFLVLSRSERIHGVVIRVPLVCLRTERYWQKRDEAAVKKRKPPGPFAAAASI